MVWGSNRLEGSFTPPQDAQGVHGGKRTEIVEFHDVVVEMLMDCLLGPW